MKKIVVNIKDNVLSFKYRTNKPVDQNLLNTNVISNNELLFSDLYLQENVNIVGLFIYDLVKEKGIDTIEVSSCELGELVFPIISRLDTIKLFSITNDDVLTYSLCEKIAKSKKIKEIECYGVPSFMIEMLDKYNVHVESRNEILFTSNFMADNSLNSYSSIYYKNDVNFNSLFTVEDLEDFKNFCQVNKYLKAVHFDKYSLNSIKEVIEVLKKQRKRNVVIEIHDDLNEPDDIASLKNLNKEIKKYKLKIDLVYSKDYLESNYLQQIIFSTLKMCAIIIFVIVAASLGYVFYNNYSSEKKVDNIKDEIADLMSSSEEEDSSTDSEPVVNSYSKLLTVNSDTVGWLTVLNTKIDYPVVQASDNSFYLNKNFYKEDDYNGWVFMDYRNDANELDDNTIIYAHNRYTSGVMFGTLTNVTKKKWYSDESNLYITFNTLHQNATWKVFSIYSINVTSDYLVTSFSSGKERLKFFNMLKNRSKVDFDTEVTENDKILTLSTCLDNDRRLVVHAVLQNS